MTKPAPTTAPSTGALKFTTHHRLRHRLVLATLTGRPLHISQIRSNSLHPGLTPYEFSFLRLLDSITNGSFFEISVTGTSFLYRPGLITGSNGKAIKHTLPENCIRGVTYFLEPLCMLAPFSKTPFSIIFDGGVITSSTEEDYSVDTLRTGLLPLLENFDISRNIEVRILKRSSGGQSGEVNGGKDDKGMRFGAGEVHFDFGHQVRLPKTVHLVNPGRVKSIKGVAYATGVTAGNNARMIEAARSVLNKFLPNVYIFSDNSSSQLVPYTYGLQTSSSSTNSSAPKKKMGTGFGICLLAQTNTYTLFTSDTFGSPGEAPEDVGLRAAYMLLHEISLGGCVGRTGLPMVLTMMATGAEGDVGRVVIGRECLDENVVQILRDIKKVMGGGEAILREWEGVGEIGRGKGECVVLGIVGRGVGNVGRKVA